MRSRLWMAFLPVFLLLAGCGGETQDQTDSSGSSPTSSRPSAAPAPKSAKSAAAALKSSVPSVTKVVQLDEDYDPNDLLGRPNGCSAAAVLYDSRAECSDGLGVDCGATVEQWSSLAKAAERMKFIQDALSGGGLGSEYDYVGDGLSLRIAGNIKLSAAKAYKKASLDR